MIGVQGRTHGGPEGLIFEVGFLSFLLCGRTEETCSMIKSLRKIDFSHLLATIDEKNRPPPLEKILGGPQLECEILFPDGFRTRMVEISRLMLENCKI